MDESILEAIVRASYLALGFSSPNPPVACVISNSNNDILATGFTQVIGGNHAEREAYANLEKNLKINHYIEQFADQIADDNADPSTIQFTNQKNISNSDPSANTNLEHDVYVTLEPCSHTGRTPPCRDLIISKKPRNVFVGSLDPNPIVESQRDNKIYSQSGIAFAISTELQLVGQAFLAGFFKRIRKNRPKIIIKSAISADGFYSTEPAERLSVSNQSSNVYLSMLRAKVDAIIVGPKTTEIDNPSLNFRIPEYMKADNSKSKLNNENPDVLFWESIMNFSLDQDIQTHHRENIIEYQPIRAFVIAKNQILSKDFIHKQKVLQELYNHKTKIVFYILPERQSSNQATVFDSGDLNKNDPDLIEFGDSHGNLIETDPNNASRQIDQSLQDSILSISNVRIQHLPSIQWADYICKDLADLGANNLLVEGGYLLYSEFGKILDEEDEILVVQNKNLRLNKGSKFDLVSGIELGSDTELAADQKSNPQTVSRKMIFQKKIDSDEWKVYKGR
ncbi:bifunctional diaminohydroxyphosphoribosylaminopyrimidine deaminase/5-amino-6-(5-phosphoribosylamino)uracil reductase RibD [Leptospira sp. GIMC2001]|uniref:bifunctional diaminohydroxyphosphoribosylaminopyrimidine deaminase/5-amino-6-(5-phosphoribosylamino)uracil reductase RibD n=1 Tax=Leptospira sp. GIMC2001 TaxID=1513297 RepID=UPI002349FD3C|nr:dihydrofolate reductase family protein [Leptospira sp. GIMC2001]WCL48388.1 dihydrofolate reductase family protein [Leptospira sp. GIMC2001]